ncbi:MAG TPA: hypothetical protein VK446_16920 [Methylocystis sp.]|nr:hypothetical protein [Methylocystis sp.]
MRRSSAPLAIHTVSCYRWILSAAADKTVRTILIPVTTMEEVSVLSTKERAELFVSLAEAEREIAEGRGAPYDGAEMRERFMRGRERKS